MEVQSNVLAQLMHDSLAQYSLAMSPGYELGPPQNLIIQKLEAVERGEITRLMVFAPPQNGKSLLVSKLFPAWYIGRHPGNNVIAASYGQDFVKGFGRAVRNYLQNPIHGAIFPDCALSDDSSAMHAFATTQGGEYFAVGRGGPTTGRGAHLIIIDDPLKDRKEASSEAIRQELKDWYSDVIYTRQRSKCSIVIVQTRWHVDDLAGWLLREHKDENWDVVCLPAIAEDGDILGRSPGEPLWPSHYPLEKLEQIQRQESTSSWLSLFQQRPTIGSGFLFRREWLQHRRYDPQDISFRDMNRAILVDPANAEKKTSDYTFMWVVGASEDKQFYVLDMVRDHFTLVERARKVFELHKKWGQPEIVGYEQYGMQADIAHLNDKMDRDHYHFHITPVGGGIRKSDRIERLEPWFREQRIWLPSKCEYVNKEGLTEDLATIFMEEEYVNYVAGGGGVKHDDGLDALSRLFDVQLRFPTAGLINRAYDLFDKARKRREAGVTPWSA